ncbi:winged helix-turn-helix domain-containing protein [Actinoplanes sp. NPDC026670]|uniref:AfsR/SARP family transcriptional regulator n=1 Tax=Actinoplanes sp. NPDC026670 TaxID=3154700 RepID=UPI0033FEB6D7
MRIAEAAHAAHEYTGAAVTVLGAVTIRHRGPATLVTNHPQREILLALAAQVGRSVPKDELIDHVWGPEAPPTARNMIYRHVGELRRMLEPGLPRHAEGRRIVRTRDGYRLMATLDTLDLLRFRDGVGRARVLEARREHHAALETFAAMLALRAGPMSFGPGRGLPGRTPVTAVRHEYLAVFKDAVDLALRVDRAGDLVHLVRRHAADLMADPDMRARVELLRRTCSPAP